MAGIANVYSDLLTKVKELNDFKFVRIWNNQFDQIEDRDIYSFSFPCAFVEIVSPTNYLPLLRGFSVSDIVIRIHIGHEEYDAGNGDFEQNVNVFVLRDAIIKKLNNYQPTACSSLMKINEEQDTSHTNIYHYIVDFTCSFIDSKGSIDEQIDTVVKDPPTDLTIEPEILIL